MNATGVIALVAVLVVASAVGLWYRRANGRLKTVAVDESTGTSTAIKADQIGSSLGERATLVQFSSSFCAPCRATRQILTEVAAGVDGVTYVEVDAESNLDLVRKLDVRRTPTTLVLDSAGFVKQRASGQPRKADVVAALGLAIPEVGPSAPNSTEVAAKNKSHNLDPHVDPVPRAS